MRACAALQSPLRAADRKLSARSRPFSSTIFAAQSRAVMRRVSRALSARSRRTSADRLAALRAFSAVPNPDLPSWNAQRPDAPTDVLRHGSPLAFVAVQVRPMAYESLDPRRRTLVPEDRTGDSALRSIRAPWYPVGEDCSVGRDRQPCPLPLSKHQRPLRRSSLVTARIMAVLEVRTGVRT